jgi:hypothetical protein
LSWFENPGRSTLRPLTVGLTKSKFTLPLI